ncbi:MAG: hypothetical protein WBM44_18925, partial [Waterburya sp.]
MDELERELADAQEDVNRELADAQEDVNQEVTDVQEDVNQEVTDVQEDVDREVADAQEDVDGTPEGDNSMLNFNLFLSELSDPVVGTEEADTYVVPEAGTVDVLFDLRAGNDSFSSTNISENGVGILSSVGSGGLGDDLISGNATGVNGIG